MWLALLVGPVGTLLACGRGEPVEIEGGKDFVCVRYERGQTECHNYDLAQGPDAWDEDYLAWPSLETPKARLQSMSTRYRHLCGLDLDGTIHCVGREEFYSPIPTGNFVEVEAGSYSNCALDAGGTARCWGTSFYESAAEFYQGSDLEPPAGPFQHIRPHENGWCGQLRDGTLTCWGWIADGAVHPPDAAFRWFTGDEGSVYCGVTTDDTVSCWGLETKAPSAQAWLSTQMPFEQLAIAKDALCVLRDGGEVVCNGLGNYPTDDWAPPAGVRFQQITAGRNFHCGLTSEDEAVDGHRVLCWGCRWDEPGLNGPARCVQPPW